MNMCWLWKATICATTFLAFPAQADLKACLKVYFEAPASDKVRSCFALEADKREKTIGRLERAIEAKLETAKELAPEPDLQAFRNAQKAWRDYRSTNCYLDATPLGNQVAMLSLCEARIADCRIRQLKNLLSRLEGHASDEWGMSAPCLPK